MVSKEMCPLPSIPVAPGGSAHFTESGQGHVVKCRQESPQMFPLSFPVPAHSSSLRKQGLDPCAECTVPSKLDQPRPPAPPPPTGRKTKSENRRPVCHCNTAKPLSSTSREIEVTFPSLPRLLLPSALNPCSEGTAWGETPQICLPLQCHVMSPC